jgi:hypothetical protein
MNGYSLANAVFDSVNVQWVDLVTGRCCARSPARKYEHRWLICIGHCTRKCIAQNTKRVAGKQGGYPGR